MEDSPKSVRAILLESECLLQSFFEIASESDGEVRAPDTEDHAVSEDWDLRRAEIEGDI